MCKDLNDRLPMTKIDLMFFPILVKEHWVLVSICKFQKEIQFFDSMGSGQTSKYFKYADNLRENFVAMMVKLKFLKGDVSSYKWAFPKAPKQNNTYDCGLYTMEFMESWDGKQFAAESPLDKEAQVLELRKRVAAVLLHSDNNVIDLDDFTAHATQA